MGSIRFSPSDSTWTPAFSGNVDIYALGGGQAGGDGDGMGTAGGPGGKGGHFAKLASYAVASGTTYYLFVGIGGSGAGVAGGDTSFGPTPMAADAVCYALGGNSSGSDVGDTTHAGGNGGTGDGSNGGGGGGAAEELGTGFNGSTPSGGSAGSAGPSGVSAGRGGNGGAGSVNGDNGSNYGGGGGGGGITHTHGNGADGTLLINWADPPAAKQSIANINQAVKRASIF